jgi:hypothetical protein
LTLERCDESSELAAPSGRRGEGAWRALLIAGTLLGSGLGMQVMHELGHVLGAWLTGGEVWRVVLHPLSISRTDLGANPHPLAVVWAGPMLGVAIPGLLWGAAAGLQTAWSRRRRARRERGGGAVGFALV